MLDAQAQHRKKKLRDHANSTSLLDNPHPPNGKIVIPHGNQNYCLYHCFAQQILLMLIEEKKPLILNR